MSAGAAHTCGLRTNGTVECWGLNDYGQANGPRGTFISHLGERGHLAFVRGAHGHNNHMLGRPHPDGRHPAQRYRIQDRDHQRFAFVCGERDRTRQLLGKQRCRSIVPTREGTLQSRCPGREPLMRGAHRQHHHLLGI